ncbi:glycosyltransferase family 4 protein [Duganella fentianensis]|uniref:glycosyltransferase family 4 protein n=1 Tax=Duganella fentianensis TaxID=2692177 RepID=UPI0032B157EB
MFDRRLLKSGQVVMVGTSLDAPGGMTAVVRLYQAMGLFERWQVLYLSSYDTPRMLAQMRVMGGAVLTFIGLLLRGRVSLLHVHSASRGSFWRKSLFCALARLFRVPYIFHLHSGEFPVFYRDECGPLGQRWVSLTLCRAARVVALTSSWRAALEQIAPSAQITVLGNPVALVGTLPPAPAERRHVLFLGRLRDKKGVYDLVRAMPVVLAQVPQARFTLAGDGDLAGTAALARELGVEAALHLPGWVDGSDKDQLLASADVLVLPSYFEGLPICVLEAMALGIPVVSTNVGGIPEVLDQGRCGILLTPGDIPSLSQAILQLLQEPARGEQLRLAAFERVTKFYSTTAVLKALDDLYAPFLSSSVSGQEF